MADAARIAKQFASGLRGDWSAFARPAQLPPPGMWSIWLMLAGSGFGKTRAGAEWVKSLVEGGASRIALVAATAGDARDIMIEGESGILSVCSGTPNRPVFEPSKRRLTWPNGAICTVFTSEEPSDCVDRNINSPGLMNWRLSAICKKLGICCSLDCGLARTLAS